MGKELSKIISLSELKVGESGRLAAFGNENKAFRRRLLDMGLTKGVLIKVMQKSPLGDPVSISLRGYQLCLRKEDTDNIKIVRGENND